MTTVFYASTLFGAMSLAAGSDAGVFGEHRGRRLLIVSNNTPIPELAPGFDRTAAFDTLRDRFDDVVSWNDVIAPMHPSHWKPRGAEEPLLARLITRELGLDGGVEELVLESVAVAPARSIGSLVRECPVTVYADGLMSYGPTRDEIPAAIGARVNRLVHPDLVPGLEPLLLREYGVRTELLPDDAFTAVVAGLPDPAPAGDAVGAPVILGQYLSPLDIVTPRGELELHEQMLDALVARGERRIVFRPHPAARRMHVQPLRRHAERLGVDLLVPDDGLPAEAWFAAARPPLVVSCFSTALFTARRLYGCEVATMGTKTVLERLAPFQNSNRIPATLADALLPRLGTDGVATAPPAIDVESLTAAVGYCMQSQRLADLRDVAAAFVAEHGADRYFKRRRLEAVGLTDRPAPRPARPTAHRTLTRAARAARAAGARRRTARTS